MYSWEWRLNELYDYTVRGLLRGDPDVKVGGPAESGGGSAVGITNLVEYCRKHSRKARLRDLSHLRKADDSTVALSLPTWTFTSRWPARFKQVDFKGDVFATEWGASYSAALVATRKSVQAFVAKTIHLIGTDNGVAPPVDLPTGRYPICTKSSTVETSLRFARETTASCSRAIRDIRIPTTWRSRPSMRIACCT